MTTTDYFIIPILMFATLIPGTFFLVLSLKPEHSLSHSFNRLLLVFSVAILVCVPFSIAAIKILGTHNGFWLIASIQILATAYILGKYIWVKVSPEFNPKVIRGYLPIIMLDVIVLIVIVVVYWSCSMGYGFAVQYDGFPFKF